MSNQRAPGQLLIGTHVDAELKRLVVLAKGRSRTVSDYLREAILEKLQREGVEVDPDLIYPPERVGMVSDVVGDNIAINNSGTLTQKKKSTTISGAPDAGASGKPPKKKPKKS